MRRPRCVYFMRPICLQGPIKIGSSGSPPDRLANLAAWSPMPIEIVHVIVAGGIELERRLHGLFRESHSHHEWFHPTPALLHLVEALRAGTPIGGLIDLSAPIIPFKAIALKAGLRNLSANHRRYISYFVRMAWAFRRLRKQGRDDKFVPPDVRAILDRWSRNRRGNIAPTAAELYRLDEVIREPSRFGVPRTSLVRAA